MGRRANDTKKGAEEPKKRSKKTKVEETNPESPVVATGTESSSVSGNLAVPTSVKAETMLPALDVVMSLQAALPHLSSAAAADVKAALQALGTPLTLEAGSSSSKVSAEAVVEASSSCATTSKVPAGTAMEVSPSSVKSAAAAVVEGSCSRSELSAGMVVEASPSVCKPATETVMEAEAATLSVASTVSPSAAAEASPSVCKPATETVMEAEAATLSVASSVSPSTAAEVSSSSVKSAAWAVVEGSSSCSELSAGMVVEASPSVCKPGTETVMEAEAATLSVASTVSPSAAAEASPSLRKSAAGIAVEASSAPAEAAAGLVVEASPSVSKPAAETVMEAEAALPTTALPGAWVSPTTLEFASAVSPAFAAGTALEVSPSVGPATTGLASSGSLVQVSPSSSPATTALSTSRGSLVQALASPKKRVLRPQRVTLAGVIGAPGGAVLHQPGHLCAVVYMLTENASLLNEHFDSSLEGIAVGFEYDEKRFKENWAAYLTSENITDSTLLETYRVICRVGPPPRYIKTLLGCGEADNCLSLMENFLLHRAAAGMPLYSVIVHNSSNQDLQEWLGGSSLPGLEVHSCSVVNAPIHFLSLGTAERRPVLIVRGVNDADVQLLLSHQTWIFRGGLPNWSGGWFDKNRQEVEKGAPGATYIRYTPAIPGIQMEGWLQAMDKYCMEYQLEGKIPGCVASVLAAPPWLSLKRM